MLEHLLNAPTFVATMQVQSSSRQLEQRERPFGKHPRLVGTVLVVGANGQRFEEQERCSVLSRGLWCSCPARRCSCDPNLWSQHVLVRHLTQAGFSILLAIFGREGVDHGILGFANCTGHRAAHSLELSRDAFASTRQRL